MVVCQEKNGIIFESQADPVPIPKAFGTGSKLLLQDYLRIFGLH